MPSVKVVEGKNEILVHVELPALKTPGAMFQVTTAVFKDGVLEVVMQPSDQKAPADNGPDEKPLEIFPE